MAFIFGDRVKETSLSVGTGSMTLGGPTPGFQSFADGVGLGNECFYGIVNTIDNTWEMGRGTVGVGTFTRDTVFSSSNLDNPVNFSVGDKLVYTTVPESFLSGVLDAPAHELIDHTLSPLNLLDATSHSVVDHTAAPFNLLSAAAHQVVDHKAAPFNLLDSTAHQGIDHTLAPLSLLNTTAHALVDHTIGPLFLLDTTGHDSRNHSTVLGINPSQVTAPERIAGSESALRSFSPADILTMAVLHGGGGGPVGIQQATTMSFPFVNSAVAIQLPVPGGFNALFVIAKFNLYNGVATSGGMTGTGFATQSGQSSTAQSWDTNGTNNRDTVVSSSVSIAGSGGANTLGYVTSYGAATGFDVSLLGMGTSILTMSPGGVISGNITLLVFG